VDLVNPGGRGYHPRADPFGDRPGSGACMSPTGMCGTFVWDGRNSQSTLVATGLYVVVIEVFDRSGNRQREVVKIAVN